MAKSAFYDATEEDSRAWRTDQDTRALAANEAGVAEATALQAATRDASPVSAISITPATVTLDISNGETQQLTVATTPANQGVQVTYVSSDPTKATVSSTGLITPLVAGSTTVTGTAVHDGALTDTCVVTVQA